MNSGEPAEHRDVGPSQRLTLGKLFLRFFRFGLLAWGGPAAQIAMIRRELVEHEHWIDPQRFNRVLAIYQALPGPEAFELCCYFGMLKRGRSGALIAGLGFMLPGLILMLAASWLYVKYGLVSPIAIAAFAGVQPAVAAMVVNAAVHLGRKTLTSPWLWACAGMSAVGQALGVGFWVGLMAAGLAGSLRARSRFAAWSIIAATLVGSAAWSLWSHASTRTPIAQTVMPEFIPKGADVGADFTPVFLWTGLKAGLLTFGGAYTAVPVVRDSAVYSGSTPWETGWMSHEQFLDGLAIGAVLPAPLVIFCTFVGFLGGGWLGAALMTIGVFAPAASFTLIGHSLFERIVDNPKWHAALDAVAASVIGVLAVAAAQTVIATVRSPAHAVLFIAVWAVIATLKRRWTTPLIIALAAAFGILLR